MILKIVLLFLVFIGVLAFFGKMHWLGARPRKQKKCPACGRYRIGRGSCACGGAKR
jgi:hypothetical protein